MVLYKRKPVAMCPNPLVEDDSQEVWMVDATREIFTDYDSYLNRIQFLKQKKFICEITGHSALDYFAALASEEVGSRGVEESFPDPLKGPILRKIQFQTISRVDTLVDVVYDVFKDDFYPGEMVTVTLQNHDKTEGLVREKVSFEATKNANGVVKQPYASYTVKLVNRGGKDIIINGNNLQRDRKIFTKAMLRAYIKNTVQRDAWNGAPWLVKDQFARKYCIDQNVPTHLQRGTTASERKAVLAYRKAQQEKGLALVANPIEAIPILSKVNDSKSKKSSSNGNAKQKQSILGSSNGVIKIQAKPEPPPPPSPKPVPYQIKYPIEDLAIMPFREWKPRPALKRVSAQKANHILEDNVPPLLETWQFLSVYCEPLLLDSFTFDDYVEALEFSSEDIDCELLVEIHCALLKCLVDEGENGKIKLSSLPVEDEDEDMEDEDEEQEEDDGTTDIVKNTDEMDIHGSQTDSPKSKHSRSSSVTGQHLAVEMDAEDNWISRLRRRDFKYGGWQAILVGLFNNMASVPRYSQIANDVLPELAPLDQPPTMETARTQYLQLDINLRIRVVQALQRLAYDTPMVREYMEECSESMTKLRKDKIEHQKARKLHLEELKGLEEERKILLPENNPQTPEPDTATANGTPALDEDGDTKMSGRGTSLEDEDDDSEVVGRSRSLRRGADRANERKRKREQEKEKAELAAKIPKTAIKFKKILQQIDKLKKQIQDEEKEIAIIDGDLREADCARLRLLGRDRFWNKYWFMERNGMPYGGLPTSSTADAGYAMGRLWLQGPSSEEQLGFLDVDDVINNETNSEGRVAISIRERKRKEEGSNTLEGPDRWAYIDEPQVLEELMQYLDAKGEREFKLKKELEIYKDKIVAAMTAREKYLIASAEKRDANESVAGTRMSTRTKVYVDSKAFRCLRWTNFFAMDELGHLHQDQPKKLRSIKKVTTSNGSFQAINKDGKAPSRQGTRYNF